MTQCLFTIVSPFGELDAYIISKLDHLGQFFNLICVVIITGLKKYWLYFVGFNRSFSWPSPLSTPNHQKLDTWHGICFYIPKLVEVDLIALFDQRLESRNQQRMFYFLTIIECYFFWICNNSIYKIWVKGSNNIEMLPWVNVSKVSFPWSLFGNKDTKLWRHHSQHFSSGKNNWASNNGPKSGVCMLLTGDLDLIISLQLIEGMCEGV